MLFGHAGSFAFCGSVRGCEQERKNRKDGACWSQASHSLGPNRGLRIHPVYARLSQIRTVSRIPAALPIADQSVAPHATMVGCSDSDCELRRCNESRAYYPAREV